MTQPSSRNDSNKVVPINGPLTWQHVWDGNELRETFHSSFEPIRKYLWLARNTESPKQYHLWSLLSLTAAVVSDSVYLNHGVSGRILLNLGVVLTGRPALRKSSAIKFMQRFALNLPLNYGPTDTGGARHGIMAVMQNRWQDDVKDEAEEVQSLQQLADSNFDTVIAKLGRPRVRPGSIYFAALELGRLLTAQTRELLDFFADGLEGDAIYYQTKTGSIRIPSPLINLLGATTPGNLPSILPRDAHDHGLLSRLIFVYAGRESMPVPIPPVITDQERAVQSELLERIEKIVTEGHGEINFSKQGLEEYERLYSYSMATPEFKLNAYAGRRAVHLAKVSALVCLLRGESPYQITREDVGLSHIFLGLTESDMDGAYVGLDRSFSARAYALLREVIESSEHQKIEDIVAMAHLSRAGFKDDEINGLLIQMKLGKKIEQDGNAILLHKNPTGDKLRIYLNAFRRKGL